MSAGAIYPPAGTVKGRVLGSLLRGEHLTHLDCWRRFHSSRLGHHVWALRRAGWDIRMCERRVVTGDHGRRATIGEYFMDRETIERAGEGGREFGAATTYGPGSRETA